MSQKFTKLQNKNDDSTAYGKWFATAVYDQRFIETEQLADFIQTQASVKKSDIKAVLDELGSAMKHFFELGQKIKLDSIGIFKVGLSSACSDTIEGCTAALVKKTRINFAPETTAVLKGTVEVQRPMKINGEAVLVTTQQQVFSHPATMLRDVRFELTNDVNGSGIESGSSGGGGSDDSGGDEPRP